MAEARLDVAAVVLTHMRPHLAGDTVRMLVERERLPPSRIIVVVNGEGGLDDPSLENDVVLIRLESNLGPAGGFAVGMRTAIEEFDASWIYVCEDDVALLDLPCPRLPDLIRRAASSGVPRIGAIVAFGRSLDRRTGRTTPYHPEGDHALEPVDLGAWGATLVHRSLLSAGVTPDARLFFGYEDFDFFLSARRAGFQVMVDPVAHRAVRSQVTDIGRIATFAGKRPSDRAEPWRHYYRARNFITLSRRYGSRRWVLVHLLLCGRRWQLDGCSLTVGRATLQGLRDGFADRLGPHATWLRAQGEF